MSTITPARAAIAHAHPYVSGETRRFKAAPAPLDRLSARVMCASGTFSTKRQAARTGGAKPILWAALLFLAAGTFAVARGPVAPGGEAQLQAMVYDGAERALVLGMDDYVPPADAAETPSALDRQDRYEIARFLRHMAPGSGPAAR